MLYVANISRSRIYFRLSFDFEKYEPLSPIYDNKCNGNWGHLKCIRTRKKHIKDHKMEFMMNQRSAIIIQIKNVHVEFDWFALH